MTITKTTSSPHLALAPKIEPIQENKIKDMAIKLFKSPLFWACILGLGLAAYSITALSIGTIPLSQVIIIYTIGNISMTAIALKYKKELLYEISLLKKVLLNSKNKKANPWFNKIEEKLYLGALPLKNKDHIEEFKKLGITTILSLVEDFEIEKHTVFSTPVSKQDWKENGFKQHHISSADFKALSLDSIKKGVKFLEENLLPRKKVYVHCKAGRGRSATIVICYLMKKYGMKPQEAITYAKAIRQLVKINRHQKKAIEKYYETIKK